MKKQLILVVILAVAVSVFSQTPQWEWAVSPEGPANGNEYSYAIATDSAGNSYITGYYTYSITLDSITLSCDWLELFVAKMDADGNWLWAVDAEGTNWGKCGWDIAVDEGDCCYVTGYYTDSATFGSTTLSGNGQQMFVAKVVEGEWIWAVGTNNATDINYGKGIAVSASGQSYITGSFSGTVSLGDHAITSAGASDIFMAKLDEDGNYLWVKQAGSISDDGGYSVATDTAGNSYFTGYFKETITFGNTSLTSNGNTDVFVAKLDGSGNWQWGRSA